MVSEVWKEIPGFEGIYQVSNSGIILSVKRNKYRKIRTDKFGYSIIGLNKGGKQYQFFVHRIVAEVFIPNPDNLAEVNHIDGNKQNNRAENLEWCSHYENIHHAFDTGLMPRQLKPKKVERKREKGVKLTAIQVAEIRSQYIHGDLTFGCKPLARKYGVTPATIRQIARREIWREV